MAGDVEARLLDAAEALFLERGYGGVTCDEVARRAGAGKATLYARFGGKRRLFEAVVGRDVERALEPAAAFDPASPMHERLAVVGAQILEHSLAERAVAMMRLVVATAKDFPDLAASAERTGRTRAVERLVDAIVAGGDEKDMRAAAHRAAERFIDLAFAPQAVRALFGADAASLGHEAAERVAFATEVTLAQLAGLGGHARPPSDRA